MQKAIDKTKLVPVKVIDKNGNAVTRWKLPPQAKSAPSTSTVKLDDATKKKLQDLLSAKTKDRTAILDILEKNGITWKKDADKRINWMRACVAAKKAVNGDSKASASTPPSTSTNTAKTTSQPATPVQPVDGAQVVQGMVKKHGRDACLDLFKKDGITWKENADPRINWMHACSAAKKHYTIGTPAPAPAPKKKAPAKPKKDETLIDTSKLTAQREINLANVLNSISDTDVLNDVIKARIVGEDDNANKFIKEKLLAAVAARDRSRNSSSKKSYNSAGMFLNKKTVTPALINKTLLKDEHRRVKASDASWFPVVSADIVADPRACMYAFGSERIWVNSPSSNIQLAYMFDKLNCLQTLSPKFKKYSGASGSGMIEGLRVALDKIGKSDKEYEPVCTAVQKSIDDALEEVMKISDDIVFDTFADSKEEFVNDFVGRFIQGAEKTVVGNLWKNQASSAWKRATPESVQNVITNKLRKVQRDLADNLNKAFGFQREYLYKDTNVMTVVKDPNDKDYLGYSYHEYNEDCLTERLRIEEWKNEKIAPWRKIGEGEVIGITRKDTSQDYSAAEGVLTNLIHMCDTIDCIGDFGMTYDVSEYSTFRHYYSGKEHPEKFLNSFHVFSHSELDKMKTELNAAGYTPGDCLSEDALKMTQSGGLLHDSHYKDLRYHDFHEAGMKPLYPIFENHMKTFMSVKTNLTDDEREKALKDMHKTCMEEKNSKTAKDQSQLKSLRQKALKQVRCSLKSFTDAENDKLEHKMKMDWKDLRDDSKKKSLVYLGAYQINNLAIADELEDYARKKGDIIRRNMYHGTKFSSVQGILGESGEFKDKPATAQTTGKMMGSGVYLADASYKSAGYLGDDLGTMYSGGSRGWGNVGHGCFFLCDAVLGNIQSYNGCGVDSSYDSNTDTVYGDSQNPNFSFNNREWAVRNCRAVVPTVVIEAKKVERR